MRPQITHDDNREYFFREGCHITEWWNRSEDEAASVARARVETGVTTRWHCLRDTTERYVVLSGRGRVELGDSRSPLIESVAAGSVVFIPSGTPQRIVNIGPDDLIFLAICTPRFHPRCYEDLDVSSDSI